MKTLLKQIYSLLVGLKTVAKHVWQRPITLEYPEKRPILPSTFRGKHSLKGCVGCGVCKQVCPANAISFEKVEEKVVSYKIDLKKMYFLWKLSVLLPFQCN